MTAMFIYVGAICENQKAFETLAAQGKTMSACDDPAEAVPECFVAENWNGACIMLTRQAKLSLSK